METSQIEPVSGEENGVQRDRVGKERERGNKKKRGRKRERGGALNYGRSGCRKESNGWRRMRKERKGRDRIRVSRRKWAVVARLKMHIMR
ncbi:hypothetical protein [Marinomonas sp. SBI22]|uniref:hypothetical protein n=1 Tax=Marinomonas sp. SBI22 TaxID=1561206 RepID=UPI0012F62D8E|nr:hypothetical protein [Marinomonas sp. SBI22]